MVDRKEYDIFEAQTGWGVKVRTITSTPTGSNELTNVQSLHATKEEAQAEADRLNTN